MVAVTYRTHPVHVMPGFAVHEGYDALAADLQRRLERAGPRPLVVIDGFVGTRWDLFVAGLRAALERRGLTARWHSTAACFLCASRIEEILAPHLTDDPVFGRLWRGHLEELWDAGRVASRRGRPAGVRRRAQGLRPGAGRAGAHPQRRG